MEDSTQNSNFGSHSGVSKVIAGMKVSQKSLVAASTKSFSRNSHSRVVPIGNGRLEGDLIGNAAFFLLKVAALEGVRRFSKARCPFIWHGFQALQLLCYPPLKWIQKWAPFRGLIKGMQAFSRPLLVLSIATIFSNEEEPSTEDSEYSSLDISEQNPEPVNGPSTPETRICNEAPRFLECDNLIALLHKELGKQGIRLPDRLDNNELRRFYVAANGDFPCFLSSVKKTILWRERYCLFTSEELQAWSNLLFWHGHDLRFRPCLIVRLGLAFVTLPPHERPHFSQAIISQVEHGVLHLLDEDNPRITVLVDCEGLAPYKIPMQTMRSCFSILQDHYPGRLGTLFVLRLPAVLRVIAQALLQVLKPTTREKLRIEGEVYLKVLSEHLQSVPPFLGGSCDCTRCLAEAGHNVPRPRQANRAVLGNEVSNDENYAEEFSTSYHDLDMDQTGNCQQVVRNAIVILIMIWLFVILLTGMNESESRS
ncbi:hypothetical protein MLD38_003555 [Melastoma candidum]|uniref:Uncharacterized protein n=1 Tax=Melastoma candidum TaxID=119954 RepID=A0ACB9S4X8_9MYRT|nr:hypothetical protein MLD38_003555 [Melastoma candidum]